jgi:hypothetical protein
VGSFDQNHRRNQNLPELPGQPYSPSAWNGDSRKLNFRFTEFYEVRAQPSALSAFYWPRNFRDSRISYRSC